MTTTQLRLALRDQIVYIKKAIRKVGNPKVPFQMLVTHDGVRFYFERRNKRDAVYTYLKAFAPPELKNSLTVHTPKSFKIASEMCECGYHEIEHVPPNNKCLFGAGTFKRKEYPLSFGTHSSTRLTIGGTPAGFRSFGALTITPDKKYPSTGTARNDTNEIFHYSIINNSDGTT